MKQVKSVQKKNRGRSYSCQTVDKGPTMFYKESILQRGLPFEGKLPEDPLNVSQMTAAQFDAELERGYGEYQAGSTISAKQAFAEIRKEHGI